MKKNILTIVVIALCFINLVLSAVIVFSVVPAMNQTTNLLNQVSSIIDLELGSPKGKEQISLGDTETYTIANQLTINLKHVEGQKKDPYAVLDEITVYLDKKAEDYSAMSKNLESYQNTISECVSDTFSKYTTDECQNNRDLVKEDVLEALADKFGNNVIVDISFKNLRFQ